VSSYHLRFYKSARIGRYVRLYATKTGVGVSVGAGGVRKTWNTSGRSTSTVNLGHGVMLRKEERHRATPAVRAPLLPPPV
jgi:hypothetical protein